jgi:hypothetical protein
MTVNSRQLRCPPLSTEVRLSEADTEAYPDAYTKAEAEASREEETMLSVFGQEFRRSGR